MSDLPNPDTREEVFLRVLADGEGDLPDPVTREERYLYAAATGSEDYPADPHTRKEIYLAAIAAGGGGGGGGDNIPINVSGELLTIHELDITPYAAEVIQVEGVLS